ncbi:hypothetical protein VYU27_000186 [Nannochloropsis oceanica]
MLGLLSVMVSGVLVAWRRIDANFSLPPDHHPYETQSYGGTRVQHKTSDMQYYMQAHEKGSTSGGPYKTLVLYVYHESDEVTKDNLLFFLKAGVGDVEDPLTDYVIIVNGEAAIDLDGLPSNVMVVRRGNTCYDGGTAGEVLAGMDIKPYQFFFFINSSVRGPFLPSYFPQSTGGGLGAASSVHSSARRWTTAFTDLLNSHVKLVGTTINCEIRVHVQSMLLATDRVGMELLLKSGALDCAENREDAIMKYELGASAVIMENGYGVDCLMLRYAGIDWLALDPPECNGMRNPYLTLFNDGMNQNPLEVVFVKVKPHILASDHILQRFSDYILGRDEDLKSSGLYTQVMQNVLSYRREKLARMVEDCHASFDHESFIAQHPELGKETPQARYETFLRSHLFSGKPYRFSVPQTRKGDVTPYYCESFVSYGAPDFFG